MKLSTKGRYAVMALVDIGQQAGGNPVSLQDIAGRQEISQEYLEQLFMKLRKAGLVDSARGPGGGYRLARQPGEIAIAEIIEAVEEPIKMTRCEDGDAIAGCVKGEQCCTHDLWQSISRQVTGFLSNVTLEDVVQTRNLALAASIRQAKARPSWRKSA